MYENIPLLVLRTRNDAHAPKLKIRRSMKLLWNTYLEMTGGEVNQIMHSDGGDGMICDVCRS